MLSPCFYAARFTGIGGTYRPGPPSAAVRLGLAFAEACLRDTGEPSELRDATVALVKSLKESGLPPEQVVVAIKTALLHHGGANLPPSLDYSDDSAAGLRHAATYRQVFRWSLDTYFNEGADTPPIAT